MGGGTYVLGRKVVNITRHAGPEEGEAKGENEATHRSLTTLGGKTFTSYHPPSTFESYGVEGVEVPDTHEAESNTQTDESGPRNKDGSKPQAEETQPGPYFRVELEGFAAPFTARTVIGPEKWLASTLNTLSPPDAQLSNTIRAVLITDAPTTFAPLASDRPAEETKLEESIIVFPSEEGAVSVLVNGASTMSCPDGKCTHFR